jgi:hypothetical protein
MVRCALKTLVVVFFSSRLTSGQNYLNRLTLSYNMYSLSSAYRTLCVCQGQKCNNNANQYFRVRVKAMVINATFSNMSVTS